MGLLYLDITTRLPPTPHTPHPPRCPLADHSYSGVRQSAVEAATRRHEDGPPKAWPAPGDATAARPPGTSPQRIWSRKTSRERTSPSTRAAAGGGGRARAPRPRRRGRGVKERPAGRLRGKVSPPPAVGRPSGTSLTTRPPARGSEAPPPQTRPRDGSRRRPPPRVWRHRAPGEGGGARRACRRGRARWDDCGCSRVDDGHAGCRRGRGVAEGPEAHRRGRDPGDGKKISWVAAADEVPRQPQMNDSATGSSAADGVTTGSVVTAGSAAACVAADRSAAGGSVTAGSAVGGIAKAGSAADGVVVGGDS